MNTESRPDEAVERFVRRLEILAIADIEDRASLARLKRGARRPLAECASLMPLFYRLLPYPMAEQEEQDYFLVATLFPFAARRWTGDLGKSLRRLRHKAKINEDGIDRRMTVLLDAARLELPFRLRQAVFLLAQNEVSVDWRRLLRDLHHWDDVDRGVQKQWARSYFGQPRQDEARPVRAMPATESDNE